MVCCLNNNKNDDDDDDDDDDDNDDDDNAGSVFASSVSARTWQRDSAYAGVVPQWDFSKGFDKYTPLSPILVSSKVVGDSSNLRL